VIRRTIAPAVIVIAALAMTGCGSSSRSTGPVIVATTTQVADFVRNVVGPEVTVVQLLAPNVEPHDYEPKPSDLTALADATAIVANGAGLDDWIGQLRDSAGASTPIIDATQGIDTQSHAGSTDPHVWMDPRLAITMVENIRDGLADAQPERAPADAARADAYITEIRRLDTDIARQIATVPQSKRRIVTDHDAFGYYARRFGVTIIGTAIPSPVSGAEPSSRDLAALIDLMRRERVRVIFAESGINPQIARALADEIGVQVAGVLWADSLGPKNSGAATYIEMMRTDTRELIAGLRRG
jgi:ABC-type Zn uptake system ZnuABC Zn-binding protein ZnuA